jgi:response regulator of citrate/malate metabolism
MGPFKKVMIVEDDPLLAVVEQKMVERLGYEVIGKAASGEEALKKIQDLNPEILLIDVQLAGQLNGIQTVKMIREKYMDIPVIFLSGDRSPSVLKDAQGTDYVEFLLKPITVQELSIPLNQASESAMLAQNAA